MEVYKSSPVDDLFAVELYGTGEWGVYNGLGRDAPKIATNGTRIAFCRAGTGGDRRPVRALQLGGRTEEVL